MNGKTFVRTLVERLRRVPQLMLTVTLAVTLAACAAQPRDELSIVEMITNDAQSSALSCSAQTDALVCESAGLRSHLDRRCSCVDRMALHPAYQ